MWDAEVHRKDFIMAVIPHLKNGIDHFKALSDLLLSNDASKDQAIRQVILKGQESLQKSDAAASAELSKVNDYAEMLVAHMGNLNQQLNNKERDLENLKSESQCIVNSMEKYRVSLSTARSSLYSAQDTLADLERQQRESETVRNIGIGIMFIPFIGPIAGGIMVYVSQTELDNARFTASRTQKEVEDCQRAINNYYSKLEDTKRRSKEKEDEIAECNRTVEQIKQSLKQASAQRTTISLVQERIRDAVKVLGTLAGRAHVAKTFTECVICLPPVVNVLGEIIKLMLQIQGNRKYEILNDPQVKPAILSLQEIYKKVSAIDDKLALNELQFY